MAVRKSLKDKALKEEKAAAGKGHNSNNDEAKTLAVIAKAAKQQKKLDEEREDAATGFRTRHKAITGDLKAAGISRLAFTQRYRRWLASQNAETAEEERRVKAEEIVFQNETRLVSKALGVEQLDLFEVEKQAPAAMAELAKQDESATEGKEDEL